MRMTFQVTVRDSLGRTMEEERLKERVIENEDYYQKTRVIDERIRMNQDQTRIARMSDTHDRIRLAYRFALFDARCAKITTAAIVNTADSRSSV